MWLADDCSCSIKWTCIDKSYLLSKCELTLDGADMRVRMSGNRQKSVEFTITDYRSKTALQAMSGHDIASGDAYLGRHFEDCVFKAWNDLGLDDGYQLPVLRDIRSML